MKQSYKYTIFFTLIVSLVFTLVLAVAANVLKPLIEANQVLVEQRALLYAFDLESTGSKKEVEASFAENIKAHESEDYTYYSQVNAAGDVLAYALPFEASGLWGTIRGWMGVDQAMDKVTGIVFTEQNETPGLGGRIDEDWFKAQFRNLPIDRNATVEYGPNGETTIDAISGATQTSNAVVNIVNQVIQEGLAELEGHING